MSAKVFCNLFTYLLLFSTLVRGDDDATSPNVVDLGYAKYQGAIDPMSQNTQFLGIRFAAPPTGTLRWREPHTPATTPGIQLANAEPNRCFEAGQGNAPVTPFRPLGKSMSLLKRSIRTTRNIHEKRDVPGFSEDCLFLNVYTPGKLGQKKNLPVVFWIHGGGYVAGSASGFQGTDIFNGNDLIRQSGNGVVVVIIQYRLGLFGFLPGKKVKQGGVLNAGLLDQQFALKWVQQHISKFGGDPNKVMIWGESAGAGSVLQQIVANGGKTHPPLFRAAVTSSSFLPSQYNFDDAVPETLYSEAVAQTNCSSAKDTLACLRQVDINTLQIANTDINNSGFFGTFVFVPVVDGTLITERPTEILQRGQVNGDIFLAITNTFEGALFVNQSTADTVVVSDYVTQLFPLFGPKQVASAVATYQNVGTPIEQAVGIMGESIFICPTYALLRAFKGRSFKGEFAIPPGGHGNDVAYYFPNGNPPPFNNADFINAFAESFMNFAMSLDPNVKWNPADITPKWSGWNGAFEMLFNRTDAGSPVVHSTTTSDALLQRCSFWNGVTALTAQ